MTDSNFRLIAKTNRSNFLLPLIVGSIPIVGSTYAILKNPKEEMAGFSKNPIGLSILTLFVFFSFGFFFYKYFFDRKNKLIIDKDGIWTSKYGHVEWQAVWYIYQKEIRGKFVEHQLIIKLNEDDRELELETTYLDKSENEIIDALKEYSSKFNVLFLDKETQKMY